MSMTLWVDSEKERTVELGPVIPCLHAFAEMAKVAGGDAVWVDEWEALAGVTNQCEQGDDADPEWLRDVSVEAGSFLELHKDRLSQDAAGILRLLRDQK